MKYCVYLIFCVSVAFSYKLPEPFKLCHRSHKDYSECVGKYLRIGLESFKNGNKEMGLPVLDPYFIEKLEITSLSPESTVAIHLTFTNVHVSGWTGTDALHMEIDFDKGCGWTIDAFSPYIGLDGDYKIDGRLMLFSLNSHGKANVTQSDGIKLCHRTQKDFTECVAKNMRGGLHAFTHGNEEMGIPSLNPYFIEKMEIKPPSPDASVAIHLIFTNLHVSGMTVTDIVHMELDVDKGCSWVMDAVSPYVILDGDYSMEGKLLLFALNSHGKANVTQVNLRNKHSMWCEKYQKKGKTHIRITNYTMDMHPDNIIFDLTNVFPSNKDIETNILKTLNENGLSIFNEIRGAFEQIFSTIHIQIANQVFSKIPFDDIFLP